MPNVTVVDGGPAARPAPETSQTLKFFELLGSPQGFCFDSDGSQGFSEGPLGSESLAYKASIQKHTNESRCPFY